MLTVNFNLDDIYLFKVKDYTTTLLGKKKDDYFYIQRGDGTEYKYDVSRIEWSIKLNCSLTENQIKTITNE